MAAALFLGQDVNLSLELGVGSDGTGLSQYLAPLDGVPVNTPQENTDVVAGLGLIQKLAEHLYAGGHSLAALFGQTNDLNLVAHLDGTALYTASGHSAAAGNGEYVLNRHQERLVDITLRRGDVFVHCIQQSRELLAPGAGFTSLQLFHGLEGAAGHHRNVVAGEVVLAQQFPNFHLHQLQQLFVVHHVGFVQPNHNGGYANLAGQQDVLTGLGHGAIGSGNNQNGSVHLSCPGDHVLHVVGVARAVNVGIVALFSFIFHVGRVNGDAPFPLFGSVVDFLELLHLSQTLTGQQHGDGSCGGGLAVVNVADGAYVDVGFGSLKLLLSHFVFSTPPGKHC